MPEQSDTESDGADVCWKEWEAHTGVEGCRTDLRWQPGVDSLEGDYCLPAVRECRTSKSK